MSYPSLTYGVAFVPEAKEETQRIFSVLPSRGVTRLDTARFYNGSEKLIGECGVSHNFSITTKALPQQSIVKSAEDSFKDLGVNKVDVYLLHAPEENKSVAEIMEEVQTLYQQGKFNKFGVSNFTAAQTRELYDYAKSKGYVLPTVYQSHYNLIGRKNETLLFPTLRELGIVVQAYSPSAAGFLLKTPQQLAEKSGSRWSDPTTFSGKLFHGLYNKPSLVSFSEQFGELGERSGVGRIGLAYRWIKYHSALGQDDTIIIGARSVKQLEELLDEIEKGPLEPWIVEKLDEMWKTVEKDSPIDTLELWSQLK